MKGFDLKSREGRTLAIVLTMLGPGGRAGVRSILLDRATEDDYRESLNLLNEFERAKDQIARMKQEGTWRA